MTAVKSNNFSTSGNRYRALNEAIAMCFFITATLPAEADRERLKAAVSEELRRVLPIVFCTIENRRHMRRLEQI